jgi:cytochrome P450
MKANPAVQNKLRATLKTAFPGLSMPSAKEIVLANIPYLDGACKETFRLAGVAKAQLRQAPVDTEILGCKVPKGAEVFMTLHSNRLHATTDEFKHSATSKGHKEDPKLSKT